VQGVRIPRVQGTTRYCGSAEIYVEISTDLETISSLLTRTPHSRTCLALGIQSLLITLSVLIASIISSPANIPPLAVCTKTYHIEAPPRVVLFLFLGFGDPYAHQTQRRTSYGFAFAARRSASLFARRRASKYSPSAKFPYAPHKTHSHTALSRPLLCRISSARYTRLDLFATWDIALRKTVINRFSLALRTCLALGIQSLLITLSVPIDRSPSPTIFYILVNFCLLFTVLINKTIDLSTKI